MAAPSGASSGGKIEVVGLKEFRKALKAMDPQWPKALRKVHKQIADTGAGLARGVASGMGGVQAHFADALRGTATQTEARISVNGRGGANVAFWGAKRHTGWYARSQFHDSTPQHPPWVGSSWEVAVPGEGPYAINPALAAYRPDIWEAYFQMVLDLAHDSFNG